MTTATPSGDPGLARVGHAVADRRLELGFASQRELAEKAGVALSTAAHLERGHTFPRRSNARKLEAALDWPPGTLAAIRRGEPLPAASFAAGRSSPAGSPSATSTAQALGIASAVAGVAATCRNILVRHTGADPAAAQALSDLDAQLLELETLIAASLPHAESFDDTMSALAEVHRHREALRDAAGEAG